MKRPETTGADISTANKSEELISLLDEHIDELELGIKELVDELIRARIFIQSKEKMHPTGLKLYEELISKHHKE